MYRLYAANNNKILLEHAHLVSTKVVNTHAIVTMKKW